MEEPQKGPSSFKRKEKKSFLDEDIGNDFLSSWKSLSVAEDDAMDFSFDTVSNGKKNTFNFEKLDMDFNLDGDFDKLPSFKVDMSDFDFPAASKKAAKPKERSEDESSTGNPQGKKNRFNFSFDFNELDSFNFESSAKEVKASSKNQDDKLEISSDGSRIEHRDSKLQPDDIAMNLPASENVATANSETLLGGPGSLNSMKKDAAKYVSSGAPILSNSDRSSPEKAMSNRTEAIDKQIHLSENAIFEEVYSQQAVLDFPGQYLNGIDSSKDTFKDGVTESCRRGARVDTTSSRREDVNDKLMAGVSSYHENLPSKNSSFIDGVTESCQRGAIIETASSRREDLNEKLMAGVSSYHRDLCSKNSSALNITASGSNNGVENKSCSDISTENVDGNESAEGREENSTSSISRKVLYETENNKENCSSKAELPTAHLCSEPLVDQVTLTNEIEAGGLHQKFSKGEEAVPLVRQSSPFEATSFSSGIERTGPSCKSPANKTEEDSSSNDTQTGPELCLNPVSVAKELKKVEDVLPMSERSVKNLNKIREGFTSDNLRNGGRLVGKLLLNGKEATRRISVIPASDRNAKDQKSLSLQVSPSSSLEKQGKFSTHTCANSKPFVRSMESVQLLKIKPIEGSRHSLVRGGKKMADLASVKIFKSTAAADKVLSDFTPQKDASSLQNTVQNVHIEGSTALETSHPFNSNEKKSPMSLSLKRKTFELSNSDLSFLKPQKRLSESPTKSRDSKEPLTRAVEEKLSSAGKSFNPLKCLPEAVTEIRDVKRPLQRIDAKESFKKIDGEKGSSPHYLVSIDKSQLANETESILYNVPAFAIETPQQVKMMEFEISSIMKNDGNIEKAEAYAKELDDICNMLKKKQEEAQEILVRAIVNNNDLLMLNHPIYEEKIHKAQKFAAELMSKELKACSEGSIVLR